MSHAVIFDVAAEADLSELYDYLLPRAGPRDAGAYIDEIIDYCASFGTFPMRGSRSDKRTGLRLVGFRRRATIAFRIKGDVVTIMRIFHRGRNVTLSRES
jgi:plasmid stabilization system protein ParE